MQATDSFSHAQLFIVLLTQAVPKHRRLSLTLCLHRRSAPAGSEELGCGQVVGMKS